MTCHVLHAGDGYTYLTNQVASGDVERSAHDPLAGYYTAEGNPPGQWAGSGLAELGVSGEVTEEHMLALFGEGLHPDADTLIQARIGTGMPYRDAVASTQLGRRFYRFAEPDIPLLAAVRGAYDEFEQTHRRRPSVAERRDIKEQVAGRLLAGPGGTPPAPETVRKYITDELGRVRQPVAGFDLVFSPVKSVSVLWGLGGHQVRQVVEQVHEAAWRTALAYGEREAGYTRIGKGGVAQIDTSGFVAAAFVHRDSRAGDPDLHTHVAVANRVRGVDGQWRTLDSQQVHKVAVSMSEVYNAALEQGLTERLGVAWTEVAKGAGKRGVREIDGVPTELIAGFSQRRSQVENQYDTLVADYVTRYGHTPPRSVQMRLAQQATLTDRPDKHRLTSLAEQVDKWTAAAATMLPGQHTAQDVPAVLAAALGRATTTGAATGAATEPVDVAAVAARVVKVVSEHRSTWTVYHVRAEAIRQLKPHAFTTAADRDRATEQVVATALGRESVELGVALTPAPPALLQRVSGESIYHRHGSTRYTSDAILTAETRLLDATGQAGGPVVAAPVARAAIAQYETATGRVLDAGQRQLAEQFVTSGRVLAVGIGPPGTGKTTAMRAVRSAWATTGGRVVGLAPSAVAASVLADELGVPAGTLHGLVAAHTTGSEAHGVEVRAGDMLLVDEAGMAGTRVLDRVRAIAAERGAVVRLLGDYRQLTAVEAGGALRLLHTEHGGTELATVHRFRDRAEATAVLQLRVGNRDCIGFYTARDRVHGGPRAAVLDQLYDAWRTDTAAGRTAIMISDSAEVARELSGRAQTARRAAGLAEPATSGVQLHDGTTAGVGDRVVTRHNARRLAVLGGTDYVKNGDLWDVLARHDDGALTARHTRHGGKVTLPAGYVAEHVELGYAATIHRAQGLTVEISRAYLSPLAVREAALVALSRGTDANHAYLDTDTVLDHGEPETLPGDLFYRHREHQPASAALTAIVRREGAELSATEQLREALDQPYRLDGVVPQYVHALTIHRGPDAAAAAADWVQRAVPDHAADVLADPAWPTLATTLLDIHATGVDPVAVLARRAAQRPLTDDPADPARSVAQVLHHRLTADPLIAQHAAQPTALPASAGAGDPARPELLPGWVPTPPAEQPGQDPAVAELGQWLRDQAGAIAERVHHLGEQAAAAAADHPAWTLHLGPVPDNPVDRDAWTAVAGHVAAYRERFGFSDLGTGIGDEWARADHLGLPELLPGGDQGEAVRARAWVAHQVEQHQARGAATPIDGPVVGLVERLRPRQDYTDLRIAWLHAQVTGDVAGEHAARRALDAFVAANPEHVQAARDAREDRRAAMEEAWRARPHSHLTDRQLHTAIDRHHQRGARATTDQAAAARRIAELAPQVAAGHGPRVQEVDNRVAELTARAALAAEHQQLTGQRQTAQTEASMAAAQAHGKDLAVEHLTRWYTLRHPGIRDRLTTEATDLRAAAAHADATAQHLQHRMHQLSEQAGGGAALYRAPSDARAATLHHQHDRHAAHTADQAEVDHLRDQISRLGAVAEQAGTTLDELHDEHRGRSTMSLGQQRLENQLRTDWAAEQRDRDIERRREQQERDRRLGLDDDHLHHHYRDQHHDLGPHHGFGR